MKTSKIPSKHIKTPSKIVKVPRGAHKGQGMGQELGKYKEKHYNSKQRKRKIRCLNKNLNFNISMLGCPHLCP